MKRHNIIVAGLAFLLVGASVVLSDQSKLGKINYRSGVVQEKSISEIRMKMLSMDATSADYEQVKKQTPAIAAQLEAMMLSESANRFSALKALKLISEFVPQVENTFLWGELIKYFPNSKFLKIVKLYHYDWEILYQLSKIYPRIRVRSKTERNKSGELIETEVDCAEGNRARGLELLKDAVLLIEKKFHAGRLRVSEREAAIAVVKEFTKKYAVCDRPLDKLYVFASEGAPVKPPVKLGWLGIGRGDQTKRLLPNGAFPDYSLPAKWKYSLNNGQRVRYLINLLGELDPDNASFYKLSWAMLMQELYDSRKAYRGFAWRNFRTSRLSRYSFRKPSWRGNPRELKKMLLKLKPGEVLIRFDGRMEQKKMPDPINFMKWFREIANSKNPQASRAGRFQLARALVSRLKFIEAEKFLRVKPQNQKNKNFKQLIAFHGQLVNPSGALRVPNFVLPGKKSEIGVAYRNTSKVSVKYYRLDMDKAIPSIEDSRNIDVRTSDDMFENLLKVVTRSKRYLLDNVEYQTTVKCPEIGKYQQGFADLKIPPLKGGYYIVSLNIDGKDVDNNFIFVPDTLMIEKRLAGKIAYYVCDALTGKPLSGMTVKAVTYPSPWTKQVEFSGAKKSPGKATLITNEGNQKTLTLTTDKNGLAYMTDEMRNEMKSLRLIYATNFKGRFTHMSGSKYDFDYKFDSPNLRGIKKNKYMNVFDRPVYRSGEKVNFKTILINKSFMKSKIFKKVQKQTVYWVVKNPQEQIIFSEKARLSKTGSADVSFKLPKESFTGKYNIILGTLKQDALSDKLILQEYSWRPIDQELTSAEFSVKSFQSPKFEIKVDAITKKFEADKPVQVKISAKYLTGEPVAKGWVSFNYDWEIIKNPKYPAKLWDWIYGNGYLYKTGEGVQALKSSTSKDYCRFFSPYSSYKWGKSGREYHMSAKLDENGEAVVDLAKKRPFDNWRYDYDAADVKLEITADVTDKTYKTVRTKQEIKIGAVDAKVVINKTFKAYKYEEAVKHEFYCCDMEGKPLAGSIVVAKYKVVQKQGNAIKELKDTRLVKVPESGKATLEYVPYAGGLYLLEYQFTGKDNKKSTVETIRYFVNSKYILNESKPAIRYFGIEEPLVCTAGRRVAKPGDKITLTLLSKFSDSIALVFPYAYEKNPGDPILVNIKNGIGTWDYKVKIKDFPNIKFLILLVRNGNLYFDKLEVLVPPVNNVAKLKVTPQRKQYDPRKKVKLSIELTDDNGNPNAGEVTIAVYNKALNQIDSAGNKNILALLFKGMQRNVGTFWCTNNVNIDSYIRCYPIYKKGLFLPDTYVSATKSYLMRYSYSSYYGVPGCWTSEYYRSNWLPGPLDLDYSKSRASRFRFGRMKRAIRRRSVSKNANYCRPKASSVKEKGPVIRKNFADQAAWFATVKVDKTGKASVEFKLPETLTTWQIKAVAITKDYKVAACKNEFVTTKKLYTSLAIPQFLTVGDKALFTAQIHNNTSKARTAEVTLKLTDSAIALADSKTITRKINLPANSQTPVKWWVNAKSAGDCIVTASAVAGKLSDAAQLKISSQPHGILKKTFIAETLKPGETFDLIYKVPEGSKAKLSLRLQNSIRSLIEESIPRFVAYPHGCNEQIASKIIPLLVVDSLPLVMRKPDSSEGRNPALSKPEFRKILIKAGIKKLVASQMRGGNWNWIGEYQGTYRSRSYSSSGYESDEMTAIVLRALLKAKSAGYTVPKSTIENALRFLKINTEWELERISKAKKEGKKPAGYTDSYNFDLLMETVGVLVESGLYKPDLDGIFYYRAELCNAMKCQLALTLYKLGKVKQAKTILRELGKFTVTNDGKTYLSGGSKFGWYSNNIETQARYLNLLIAIEPGSKRTKQVVDYLISKRTSTAYWNSTKDSAACIEALAKYLNTQPRKNIAIAKQYLEINNKKIAFSPAFPSQYIDQMLLPGENKISFTGKKEIYKPGFEKSCYLGGVISRFTNEKFIKASTQNKILKISRAYYKLNLNYTGKKGELRNIPLKCEPGKPLPVVKAGDVVYVVLTVEAKQPLEHLLLEDNKPACAVSDYYSPKKFQNAFTSEDSQKVKIFFDRLPVGKKVFTYKLRIQTPGVFSALPARIETMYYEKLFANSDEFKIKVDSK